MARFGSVVIRIGRPRLRWGRAALVVGPLALAGLIGGLASGGPDRWSGGPAPPASSAALSVVSAPSGATVTIDGREQGVTPLVLLAPPGDAVVGLRRAGMLDEALPVQLAADRPLTLVVPLWAATPTIAPLRAPIVGRAIVAGGFVRDGRVALTTAPPQQPNRRELWLVDAHGRLERIGPPTPMPILAVAGDGAHVAYLTTAASATARPSTGAWSRAAPDEVWLTSRPDDPGGRILAVSDVPELTGHWLTDLLWAPDERHLLVVGETQLPSGAIQTRFVWLPLVDGAPAPLAAFDGRVAPGSWRWSPAGDRLAFLAEEAPGRSTVLAVLTPAAETPAERLRNVADADGAAADWLPTGPLAWTPDGRGLLFPLSVTTWGAAPAFGLTDLSARVPVTLAGVAGQASAWRDPATLLTLQPTRDGGLALRRTTLDLFPLLATSAVPPAASPAPGPARPAPNPTPPATSHALALAVGGGAVGAVWDVERRQAFVVAPQRSARQGLAWWWVRWAAEDGDD